jgi:hypothetical protein
MLLESNRMAYAEQVSEIFGNSRDDELDTVLGEWGLSVAAGSPVARHIRHHRADQFSDCRAILWRCISDRDDPHLSSLQVHARSRASPIPHRADHFALGFG